MSYKLNQFTQLMHIEIDFFLSIYCAKILLSLIINATLPKPLQILERALSIIVARVCFPYLKLS